MSNIYIKSLDGSYSDETLLGYGEYHKLSNDVTPVDYDSYYDHYAIEESKDIVVRLSEHKNPNYIPEDVVKDLPKQLQELMKLYEGTNVYPILQRTMAKACNNTNDWNYRLTLHIDKHSYFVIDYDSNKRRREAIRLIKENVSRSYLTFIKEEIIEI